MRSRKAPVLHLPCTRDAPAMQRRSVLCAVCCVVSRLPALSGPCPKLVPHLLCPTEKVRGDRSHGNLYQKLPMLYIVLRNSYT